MLTNSNFETLPHRRRFSIRRILLGVVAMAGTIILISYVLFFGAPARGAPSEQFIIPLSQKTGATMDLLLAKGFIKNDWVFATLFYAGGKIFIEPGGYTISKSMNAWEMARAFTRGPQMKWVIIPEGLRKEEIATILAEALGWSVEKKAQFIQSTAQKPNYKEGVFFPDTYLIDKAEDPAETAQRLIARFEEKIAPYVKEGLTQNIKWTTLVKLASIIEREAAGEHDMPLIAGVLWNRLDKNMRLEVDATLQYARGDVGDGWWAPIKVEDKKIDSPYNTYTRAGLPPTPIANPGVASMAAVITPAKTDCLFYLHDTSRQIHCAKTYDEHKINIEKYLK
jgi:UPF0755 protein